MLSGTIPKGLKERIQAVVEETIAGTGVFLVEIAMRGRVGARIIEVFLDHDDGIGVDQLAALSRQIGLLLDASDLVDGKYRLDVSTPGVDRPLVPRQLPRNIGRKLRLVVASDSALTDATKPEIMEGTLVSADPDRIVVRDGTGHDREVSVQFINEVKVLLPW